MKLKSARSVFVLSLALPFGGMGWAASDKPDGTTQARKDARRPVAAPRAGIKTPGVQIPYATLKPEAEIAAAPEWMAVADVLLFPNAEKGTLERVDPKTNKLGDAVPDVSKPCGGAITAFGSLWVANCGSQEIVRLDPKTFKATAKMASGTPSGPASAPLAIAASADSIWAFTDSRTTLSRVDPDRNQVVAEIRLPAGCNTLTFGETALWATCPSEDRVLRINPQTNLVEKRIEVSAHPVGLAIGENSLWVLCQKDGKVERIDPKTNKISKTIDLAVPGVAGAIAIGAGSVWVTQDGFPLTRIDPQTDKVAQQFWGPGGGAIQFGAGALWISNLREKTLWRVDPKRVLATLAE